MLALEVEVNGERVTTAGVADAEKIDAVISIYPGINESWVKVSGEVIPDANPPADASWFHRKLALGESVTVRLVESVEPTLPKLTRSDPSIPATDSIPFACSFCGKPSIEIQRMYAGPKAQICNECIQFMHEVAVADGVGSNKSLELTREQAYLAMFSFLEANYGRSKADDVGALLSSMALLTDGRPADPAFVEDWRLAVEAALSGKVDAALRLSK